jgi:CheY-like chemotaxis protein
MMTEDRLSGLKVLIVEDESLVSMLIEDALADLGCRVVGVASGVDEALDKAATLPLDAAILDVNLHGKQTAAVAEILKRRGVPFLFATGYGVGGLPDGFRNTPFLQKPFHEADLERVLRQTLEFARHKSDK